MKKIVRFFQKSQRQILLIAAFASTLFVFQAPLKFILFDAHSDTYLKGIKIKKIIKYTFNIKILIS